MKFILFTLVFINTICVYSQQSDFISYYPLEIGNSWEYQRYRGNQYSLDSIYYYVEIEKDTIIQNTLYKKVVKKILPEKRILRITFERIDSSQGLALLFTNSGERIIDDFNSIIDEKYWTQMLGIKLPDYGSDSSQVFIMDFAENSTFGKIKEYYVWRGAIGMDDQYRVGEKFGFISYFGRAGGMQPAYYTVVLRYASVNGFEYGKSITSLKNENDILDLPASYSLAQNYPNPFNPITIIKYSIPYQSNVYLKVFDVLGREIKTLVNKEQPTGNYEVEFNASNLPSGVYFISIVATGVNANTSFRKVNKALLIK